MKLQNSAGGSKCRCLYHFVLSWNCLRTNKTGSPCAKYYAPTAAPETTSCPPPHPFPKSKAFQVHTGLDYIEKKSLLGKALDTSVFSAFPNWDQCFWGWKIALYTKKMSQCLTMGIPHQAITFLLPHAHPPLYLFRDDSFWIQKGLYGACEGQTWALPKSCLPSSSGQINTHS